MLTQSFDDYDIRGCLRALVAREQRRSAAPQRAALATVARRLHLSPGTLWNVLQRRTKTIATHVSRAIQDGACADLESEIARLSHELHLLRQGGMDLSAAQMAQVEALLAQARALLARRQNAKALTFLPANDRGRP